VFWWGFGVLPKLGVIVLICFFPVVVTTVDGLASVDPDQLKLLRTLGASRWQALRWGELPAALPAALSGARIALAVGVIGAYIAETSYRDVGAICRAGTSDQRRHKRATNPRAHTPRRLCCFAFAIACFYTLALAERVARAMGTQTKRRDPLRAPSKARRASAANRYEPRPDIPGAPDSGAGFPPSLALLLALGCLVALGACGSKQDTLSAPAMKPWRVMLDFFPNADHAALYEGIANGDFRAGGLDVKPQTPSDPSTPLKLLAAGRVDMAISYEPELLLARDQGPETGVDRGTRAAPANLDHRAAERPRSQGLRPRRQARGDRGHWIPGGRACRRHSRGSA